MDGVHISTSANCRHYADAPQEGPSAVSALMNRFWLPRFLGYGWRVRAVGWSDVHDRESLVAGTVDISPLALAGIRRACGLEERSALVRLGPPRPLIQEKHDVPATA
jgi:acyl-homoserine lactone synthase